MNGIDIGMLLLSTHSHKHCLWGESDLPVCGPPPASPSIWPAVESLWQGLSTNDVCCVCECYKGVIVVMDMSWSRICVSMI